MQASPSTWIAALIATTVLLAGCGGTETPAGDELEADLTTSTGADADPDADQAAATTEQAGSEQPTVDDSSATTGGEESDAGSNVVDRLSTITDEAELSQLATNSNDPAVVVFDSFETTSNEAIAEIAWEGGYCRVVDRAPEPAPTATGFLLTVHTDLDGRPDQATKVASYGFDISEIRQSLLTTESRPCGSVTSTWAYYRYSVPLAEPLVLETGRRYWLSIQALTENFGTRWSWRGSTDGDRSSIRLSDGQWSELSEDRAFALLH